MFWYAAWCHYANGLYSKVFQHKQGLENWKEQCSLTRYQNWIDVNTRLGKVPAHSCAWGACNKGYILHLLLCSSTYAKEVCAIALPHQAKGHTNTCPLQLTTTHHPARSCAPRGLHDAMGPVQTYLRPIAYIPPQSLFSGAPNQST